MGRKSTGSARGNPTKSAVLPSRSAAIIMWSCWQAKHSSQAPISGDPLSASGGVVNSLDFYPVSLKSLGCFYFRCVSRFGQRHCTTLAVVSLVWSSGKALGW